MSYWKVYVLSEAGEQLKPPAVVDSIGPKEAMIHALLDEKFNPTEEFSIQAAGPMHSNGEYQFLSAR